MPLNEIAKVKLIDWLKSAQDSAENDRFDQLSDRGRNLMAMGEIFTEDEEWSKELMSSGTILTYVSFLLRNYEDMKEEQQNKIKDKIIQYLNETSDSVISNNWLTFHKSIRNMLYDIYQLS